MKCYWSSQFSLFLSNSFSSPAPLKGSTKCIIGQQFSIYYFMRLLSNLNNGFDVIELHCPFWEENSPQALHRLGYLQVPDLSLHSTHGYSCGSALSTGHGVWRTGSGWKDPICQRPRLRYDCGRPVRTGGERGFRSVAGQRGTMVDVEGSGAITWSSAILQYTFFLLN